jgi:hypothetical protein
VIRPALFHQPVLEREILIHPVNIQGIQLAGVGDNQADENLANPAANDVADQAHDDAGLVIHPDGGGDSDNSDSDEELEQPDVVVVEDQSESSDEDYYAMAATAQPPLFYGLHSEDPNTWITNVSWYILTTKANNDKARIAFVSMLLRDEARRWCNSLVINANPGQAADGQAADGQAAPGQAAAVQPPADGPNPPIATFEAF